MARSNARRRGAALAVAGCALTGLLGAFGATLAGCSSGPPPPGATGTSCGTARTGANALVDIKVTKGTVDCATVLGVERSYAAMIRDGDVRGNGGGAPVTVDGWICESYATPQVLRTREASRCHTASAEVAAVLAGPAASTSAGS